MVPLGMNIVMGPRVPTRRPTCTIAMFGVLWAVLLTMPTMMLVVVCTGFGVLFVMVLTRLTVVGRVPTCGSTRHQ